MNCLDDLLQFTWSNNNCTLFWWGQSIMLSCVYLSRVFQWSISASILFCTTEVVQRSFFHINCISECQRLWQWQKAATMKKKKDSVVQIILRMTRIKLMERIFFLFITIWQTFSGERADEDKIWNCCMLFVFFFFFFSFFYTARNLIQCKKVILCSVVFVNFVVSTGFEFVITISNEC